MSDESSPERPEPYTDALRAITPDLLIAIWQSTIDEGSGHFSREVKYPTVLAKISNYLQNEALRVPPWEACGTVLFRFVDEQPFGDCNHRTGWFLVQALMARAGYRLVRSEDHIVDFLRGMVNRAVTREQAIAWVRESFAR
ncbi:MAG: Fic family protein [Euryarchaeota archaeon]|nr:Fic family protein [Euryarchaeota archaeon]MDE1837366.1 Fic family protein [Euryarchaeota archaeon]MDE1881364.1 Fic family protein [Euryarchaeota archaeon]MDE2045644.1 Fic family protein [Thermoplasmata archaeon]